MITKRQLGIAVVAGSIVLIVVVLGIELLEAGMQSGIGPLQRLLLALALGAALVGGLLISRGDRPA